jgi:hypothetical protein
MHQLSNLLDVRNNFGKGLGGIVGNNRSFVNTGNGAFN